METARKRIIDFIEYQGIKPNVFLQKTGLKRGFIDRSHQNSGASDIFLSKILDVYPEINAEWLLSGKGSMLKSDAQKSNNDNNLVALLEQRIQDKEKIIHVLEKQIKLLEDKCNK